MMAGVVCVGLRLDNATLTATTPRASEKCPNGDRKYRGAFWSSRGIELLTPRRHPQAASSAASLSGNPAGNPVRPSVLFVMAPLLIGVSSAPAQDDADTTALCPAIDFTGFSTGAGNARIEEKLRWDAARRSYLVQGPELAQRFLYPDPKRVYELPVDRTVSVLDQDICRPKIEISGRCEIVAVPGAASEPAYVFTADYQDDCDQKPVQVAVRVEQLTVGARKGIQLSFFNAFRQIYDSGMDIYEGENVVNSGYRLK
jgi:hypothetical protein